VKKIASKQGRFIKRWRSIPVKYCNSVVSLCDKIKSSTISRGTGIPNQASSENSEREKGIKIETKVKKRRRNSDENENHNFLKEEGRSNRKNTRGHHHIFVGRKLIRKGRAYRRKGGNILLH